MFSKSEQENYTVDLTPTFFGGPIDTKKIKIIIIHNNFVDLKYINLIFCSFEK